MPDMQSNVASDFLISTWFDDAISESVLALFYRPLRISCKKGTDNEIAYGSKVPVSLRYEWLFRHQSLFAPSFYLFTGAIRNFDEARKSEIVSKGSVRIISFPVFPAHNILSMIRA